MEIYLYLYLTLIFLSIIENIRELKLASYFIAITLLLIFFGLRYQMGNDWLAYTEVFNTISNLNFNDIFTSADKYGLDVIEIGFRFYFFLVSLLPFDLINNFEIAQFLITCFYISIITYFLIKRSNVNHIVLFLLLFFGFSGYRDFDLMRQTIAFSIILTSITFFYNSAFLYIISITMASLFHSSSLIFLPFFFLFKYKPNKLIFRILTLILFIFLLIDINFDLFRISNILHYISVNFGIDKLEYYITTSDGIYKNLGLFVLISMISQLIISIYPNSFYGNNQSSNFIISLVPLNLIVFIVSPSMEFYERFSYFFIIGIVYILIKFIDVLNTINIKLKYSYILLILFLPIIRFNNIMSVPQSLIVYIPYKNYLFVDLYDQDAKINLIEKIGH
jgi:transmembrane protein EpsG